MIKNSTIRVCAAQKNRSFLRAITKSDNGRLAIIFYRRNQQEYRGKEWQIITV
ncbi:hypothetical protein [Arsenophonus endosymbiont of Aphis craccivora]|uniref:hypothetical protein n=1 Tax=Arsenophonus endosymbiont of Aphis craccivora TaxID=1231049 RepID=UPI001EE354BE|nr:hypothetical protein [Arsenophonus endosymbiont of Aphis craccivora]